MQRNPSNSVDERVPCTLITTYKKKSALVGASCCNGCRNMGNMKLDGGEMCIANLLWSCATIWSLDQYVSFSICHAVPQGHHQLRCWGFSSKMKRERKEVPRVEMRKMKENKMTEEVRSAQVSPFIVIPGSFYSHYWKNAHLVSVPNFQ